MPPRELRSLAAAVRAIAPFEPRNELDSIGGDRGADDIGWCIHLLRRRAEIGGCIHGDTLIPVRFGARVCLAVGDVVADGIGEEHRLLQDRQVQYMWRKDS